jgi:putative oxidoreductase
MNNMKAIETLGRCLLGLYFLVPGIMKFVAWQTHVDMMEKHQMMMVPVLLALAGIIQILGAALIILNRWVSPSALVLAAMVLMINFNLHDFWNYSGVEGAHEMQNFVKNLGVFAGLLLLSSMHGRRDTV